MTETKKKVLIGTVVGTKMKKTAVVKVVGHKVHPFYRKRIVSSKKYKVHDEKNECTVGDEVEIIECRPLSREKHFRLQSIVKKADGIVVDTGLEADVEKAMKVEKKVPQKPAAAEAPVKAEADASGTQA